MDDHDSECIWAIQNGEQSIIKEIIEEKKMDINKEINGRFPLHFAADYGQAEILSYLLSKGAKVNLPDKYGVTPLLSAVFEGHKECVKLLLENGADKTGKSPGGDSYFDCAEDDEIKQLLR